jgi:uncharacterized protein YejL (UPF0352 family)
MSTGTRTALTQESNTVAIKVLQLIHRFQYDASVTEPITQTLKAMKQRVEYEARQLKAIETEMATLLEKHLRYEELAELDLNKSRLLNKLRAVLEKNSYLKHLKLWEVLEVYLSFVKEAQVADILGFFEWIGYEGVSRQALESTIKTHKHSFTVRKEGWDRFISLAGKETDAASTTEKRK